MQTNNSYKVIPVFIDQFIQMLFDETSICYKTPGGRNVIYEIEMSEWKKYFPSVNDFKRFEDQSSLLSRHSWKFLPNNLPFAQLHDYETDYLFNEIFVEKIYSKHDIFLPENACILDIGANIGLFSLYAKLNCPTSIIYAFEPIKLTHSVLKDNFEIYNIGHALNHAVANENGQQLFTCYKNSTVFSGKYAKPKRDEPKVKSIAKNIIQAEFQQLDEKDVSAFVDLVTRDRMEAISEKVNTVILNTFIKDNNILNIDLLKIDAEGCEFEILSSLSTENWNKIKQLVIEVHPKAHNDVYELENLLEKHNFYMTTEEEDLLLGSGLLTIYAKNKNYILSEKTNKISKPFFNELQMALLNYEKRGKTSLFISLGKFSGINRRHKNLWDSAKKFTVL